MFICSPVLGPPYSAREAADCLLLLFLDRLSRLSARLGSLAEGVDGADVILAHDETVVALQVLAKFLVVIQPPEGRLGQEQVASPLGPQLLQPGDGIGAVRRLAVVVTFRIAREVPAPTLPI